MQSENTATGNTHKQQESTASGQAMVDDDNSPPPGEEMAGWFNNSALRIGLVLIGWVSFNIWLLMFLDSPF